MKKILIFSQAMELGGAETALLGLLDTIDTKKYSVDLFLMRHSGELLKYIPSKINLLPENSKYASLAVPFRTLIKTKQFKITFLRFFAKILSTFKIKQLRVSGNNAIALEYSHKYTKSAMPKISNIEYDLAISFLTPHYFVTEKVNAKRKIAWIHTDYSYVKVDTKSELNMWEKYDKIISISNTVTDSFVKTFPSLKEKVTIIENIISKNYINSLVGDVTVENEMHKDDSFKLLSIGRFCHAKNFDNLPQICKLIRENGLNVKWYLIGFGSDETLIRKKIIEYSMQNYVTILGKKENPYPYIKACDIYIQPSRYEGKSIAVREAQLLNKPVVITNYPTAQSQLKNGFDGVIVPMDVTECANAISDILKNYNLQQELVKNTSITDYTNSDEINKLYKLVD
jgi:glycosyltransferase involved in cell wall biosynthesis